jgi:hypothetical protein
MKYPLYIEHQLEIKYSAKITQFCVDTFVCKMYKQLTHEMKKSVKKSKVVKCSDKIQKRFIVAEIHGLGSWKNNWKGM